MADRTERVKREVLVLVALALVVDAVFVVGFYAAGLAHASAVTKVIYTAAWTVMTMLVVLRGLTRIRGLRSGPGP